jgi:hypothetical protein
MLRTVDATRCFERSPDLTRPGFDHAQVGSAKAGAACARYGILEHADLATLGPGESRD